VALPLDRHPLQQLFVRSLRRPCNSSAFRVESISINGGFNGSTHQRHAGVLWSHPTLPCSMSSSGLLAFVLVRPSNVAYHPLLGHISLRNTSRGDKPFQKFLSTLLSFSLS
jgi:hypothetical protein